MYQGVKPGKQELHGGNKLTLLLLLLLFSVETERVNTSPITSPFMPAMQATMSWFSIILGVLKSIWFVCLGEKTHQFLLGVFEMTCWIVLDCIFH